MALLNDNNPITTDGDYEFSTVPGKEYSISFNGTFGSGTFAVQYDASNNNTGTYKTYNDGTFTGNDEGVFLAHSKTTNINVSGATTPSVTAKINEVFNG